MTDDHDAAGAMNFIFEAGVLKRAARTGWWFAGVKQPESIAEHSFRTALIGMMLAAMEGADPARVSMLCTLHDTQETRITDIPHIAKRYLTAVPNTAVTADQVAACPQPSPTSSPPPSPSTKLARRWKLSSPATQTSWNASSKPSSTATKASTTCSAGSTAHEPL